MEEMHSLLKRQLKKYFGATFHVPAQWERFIEVVDAAYKEFDADRTMLERSLDLSSQELLQANSEMRAIFQSIPDLLFRLSNNGTILDSKAGGTSDFYRSTEELKGRRIQDVPPEEVGRKFAETVRLVVETKSVASFEYSLAMRNQISFYEARLLPLLDDQIIAIIRNITSRKEAEKALRESEEKYRTLVENVNVGIYRSADDMGNSFLQANPAMAKIFGYSSIEEFLKVPALQFFRNPEQLKLIVQEISSNGFVKDRELLLHKKDGTPIVVSCTAKAQYNANGTIKWVDGVIEDITERKQAEEEILKSSKLESLGILAGGIAHDFNNILTAVIGNISLAKSKVDPESPSYSRLAAAERASSRAQDLTQQLLTFSKGGAPIRKSASIEELLKESARFVMSGSNVLCNFSIADDLLPADIDEGQISQVINNLVINTQQAMPRGGTITISAENVTVNRQTGVTGLPLEEGKYIKITIQDQGTGIPEDHLDKIFDPYFTTKQHGSGLGLTTTYTIIKKHGGYISVKSQMGVGTTFSIYLPASRGRLETKKVIAKETAAGQGRILIMDDEEIIRDVAGSMMLYLGYDVDFAKDGDEAIDRVRKAVESGIPFNIIIMDLTIPGGMGGKDAVQKILAIDPKIKAIASSGYSNDPIMAEFKKYGFSAIVPKPYKLEDVNNALQQVTSGSHASTHQDIPNASQ
jgi:PAS domain S-box-containing protein